MLSSAKKKKGGDWAKDQGSKRGNVPDLLLILNVFRIFRSFLEAKAVLLRGTG